MSTSYNVRTKSMLIHPSVETVIKLGVYAAQHGITRTSAASRLLNTHPDITSITLDSAGQDEAEGIVARNLKWRELQKKARAMVRKEMSRYG